jgi:ankyrin repeat protein
MELLNRLAIVGVACLVSGTSVLIAADSRVADAAMRGDKTTLRTFLEQKADVNAPQADGATAIQWAAYRNDLEMAGMLITAGADVNRPNLDGATPLWLAAENGNAAMIERLIAAGAEPDKPQANGATALMMASRTGNVDAINALLAHKADPGLRENLRGTTALMWAAEQSHPEALKTLVAHGADVNAASAPDTRNSRLNIAPTIQQRIQQDLTFGGGGRSKGAAAKTETAAVPDDFAAFFRESDKKDGGGLTPLVIAAREGCLECVQVLLSSGANVNQTTNYGWTPTRTRPRAQSSGIQVLPFIAPAKVSRLPLSCASRLAP